MGFRALCIENRCKCSYSSGFFVATMSDTTKRIHLSEIASVTFCTTEASITAYLLSELAKAKIPVIFSDEKFLPVAECLPMHGAHNNSARISDQLEWSLPNKKRLWQKIVQDKILLQARVLELNGHADECRILRNYAATVRSGDPDNREAVAAALYFSSLFGTPFNRNLECPLNASLDYGYSIILSKVAREIASKGYMTEVGIHHRGDLNPWNLACDLMEPFRPYIDVVIVRTNQNRFDSETRRQLIGILFDDVQYKDGFYKMGSVISLYVKDCLDVLEKRKELSEVECYKL